MNVMLSKTFFPQHPKAGEATHFAKKVIHGEKRHTCRCNYDYWHERITKVQERGGVLSLRQWSGRPYEKGSTQERIMDVPASMVEVQRLVMSRQSNKYKERKGSVFEPSAEYRYFAEVDGTPIDVAEIAKNDGLTLEDFKAWFNPVFDEYEDKHGTGIRASALTFAVIQFTTFRY